MMPKQYPDGFNTSPEIPDDEVINIVAREFPHWKLICGQPGDEPIVISQRELGRTPRGIFSMHIVIRFAGIVGKKVLIVPDALD